MALSIGVPRLSLAVAALMMIGSLAHGQSLNVSIVNGPPSKTFGAAAGQTGYWNVALVKSTLLPWALNDLSGGKTSVLFDTSTPGSDLFLNDPATSGDDEKLMDGGHNIGPFGTSQIKISGLADGDYELYTYAWTPTYPGTAVAVMVPGSTDPGQKIGGPWPPKYTQGVTHAKHDISLKGGILYINLIAGGKTAMVNGFQLIQKTSSAWTDLGKALPGSVGAPLLVGVGDLTAGTTVGVDLSNAVPNGQVIFIVGGTNLSAPFFGGILVPFPNIILPPLPLGPSGSLVLGTNMPAGVPSGLSIYVQGWIPDIGGPQGYAASNALMATTP